MHHPLTETEKYEAVCVLIADKGVQETPYGEKEKLYFKFEVPSQRIEYEKDGEKVNLPMTVGVNYTASLSERANLRKAFKSWRGRDFTPEELEGFDIETVLGAPAQLVIGNYESDGKTRASIDNIIKSKVKAQAEGTLQYFDADNYADAPEWLGKQIAEGHGLAAPTGQATQAAPAPQVEDDSDIPF